MHRSCSDGAELARIAFGDHTAALAVACPGCPPEHRWLAAVAAGAQGRYARACALLDGLHGDRTAPRAVRAHAAVTRAAHLRQLGGHLAARRWDARGLALSTGDRPVRDDSGPDSRPDTALAGTDLAAARIDAVVGLAADAIGLAELGLADRLLSGVEREIVCHLSWRPSVRMSWVCAELALARGHSAEASRWARHALAGAEAAGSVRHVIKSELVLLVAESGGTGPEAAVNRLNLLFERVQAAGLDTLVWVIHFLLAGRFDAGDSVQAGAHRRCGRQILREIRFRTDPVGRSVLDRSPWVPDLRDG